MSTKKALQEAESAGVTKEPEVQLPLQDYCIRLSKQERRVELIAGFEHDERNAGRVKDTESAFAARYQKFINRPA